MHVYVPWWLLDDEGARTSRAAITSRSAADSACRKWATFHGVCQQHEGYGTALKDTIRKEYGAWVGFSGRGEMIPNDGLVLRDRSGTW